MIRQSVALFTCMVLASRVLGADADQRAAVPDVKSQAVADTSIKNLMKADFARHAPADRLALASKLLGLAAESKNSPAERYVLIRDAEDLAILAADTRTMSRAVDLMADAFSVNAVELKLAALARIVPNMKTPEAGRDAAKQATELCEAAIGDQHFEEASRAAAIASSAAEKSHDKDLIAGTKQRVASVEHVRDQYAKSEQALQVLQKAPEDEAANTTVGRYLCFDRGDWERGLPYLAHVSDASLHGLAMRDLGSPTQALQMQKLADDWWEWAEKAERNDVAAARSRAAYWYATALPELKGLQKSLDEKRIEQAAAGTAIGKRVIDLIPLIDVGRDVVAGEWKISGHTLVASPSPLARLQIRYAPPTEYDFRIKFRRATGHDSIVQMMSKGGHHFLWAIAGGDNGLCGIGTISGKNAYENETSKAEPTIVADRAEHVSVVAVRRNSIAAYVDGKLIARCATDFSNITIEPAWDAGPAGFGLGCYNDRLELDRVELIEITGHGKPEATRPR